MTYGNNTVNWTSLDSIVIDPGVPHSMTIDSTGKFVYFLEAAAGTLHGYNIGTNGSVTPIGLPTPTTGLKIAASR